MHGIRKAKRLSNGLINIVPVIVKYLNSIIKPLSNKNNAASFNQIHVHQFINDVDNVEVECAIKLF